MKNIFLLLKIVHNNRSLNALLRENLTFKEIGDLTEKAFTLNLIQKANDDIELTLLGETVYRKLSNEFKKTNKAEWIDPEKSSQIPQLDINFIYLPDQRFLEFDS